MNRDRIVKLRDDLENMSNALNTAHDEYAEGKSIGYLTAMNRIDSLLEICDCCDGRGDIGYDLSEPRRGSICPRCNGSGKEPE